MADYDRRRQRLEDRGASNTERPSVPLEWCQKRTAELLASKEVLAYTGPEASEGETAAVRAVIQASIEAARRKW